MSYDESYFNIFIMVMLTISRLKNNIRGLKKPTTKSAGHHFMLEVRTNNI